MFGPWELRWCCILVKLSSRCFEKSGSFFNVPQPQSVNIWGLSYCVTSLYGWIHKSFPRFFFFKFCILQKGIFCKKKREVLRLESHSRYFSICLNVAFCCVCSCVRQYLRGHLQLLNMLLVITKLSSLVLLLFLLQVVFKLSSVSFGCL